MLLNFNVLDSKVKQIVDDIYYSFVETIRFQKFKCNILNPSCLLKNQFILFLPIVDKYIELYQTGKLCLNQIFTIIPSFPQIHNIKETKLKWLKRDHSYSGLYLPWKISLFYLICVKKVSKPQNCKWFLAITGNCHL